MDFKFKCGETACITFPNPLTVNGKEQYVKGAVVKIIQQKEDWNDVKLNGYGIVPNPCYKVQFADSNETLLLAEVWLERHTAFEPTTTEPFNDSLIQWLDSKK